MAKTNLVKMASGAYTKPICQVSVYRTINTVVYLLFSYIIIIAHPFDNVQSCNVHKNIVPQS